MICWIMCYILGILTTAFSPLLIATVVRILKDYARKYPSLTDVVATITLLIVSAELIAMSVVFAAVYHYLITGVR